LIKVAQFAEVVLPITAMGWVGYQVFIQFYQGSLAAIPHYVGTDFAINSTMLIAIAWLFPYFLQKKLKPSIEKAALKGLNQGLITALQTLEIEVVEVIKENASTQQALREKAESIVSLCNNESEGKIEIPENSSLERMLL
ncbi:MAG: GTP-binding protein, partial [Methyloprofundus sp.]|nr:GTP-binding protein [Methyloprofundus sp.]